MSLFAGAYYWYQITTAAQKLTCIDEVATYCNLFTDITNVDTVKQPTDTLSCWMAMSRPRARRANRRPHYTCTGSISTARFILYTVNKLLDTQINYSFNSRIVRQDSKPVCELAARIRHSPLFLRPNRFVSLEYTFASIILYRSLCRECA